MYWSNTFLPRKTYWQLKLLEGYITELKELQDVTFQEYQANKFIRRRVVSGRV